MNLLSIDMVQHIKYYKMLETPPIELKTLSGTTVISNHVLECEIVLGYKTQFVISNSSLSPAFEVILGFNFLNYFNFVINCGENTIKNDVCIKWNFKRAYPYGFEYNIQHEMKPDNSLNENSNALKDQNVKSKQNGKPPLGRAFTKPLIPPGSQRYVDIKIDDVNNNFDIGNIILLEKNPNLPTSSIMIARAVSTLKENNMCLALVLNLEDKPLTLNKGMIIVQALPIHEVSNIESVNTLSDSKNSKNIDWDKTLNFDHLSKEQKSKVIKLLNKYDSIFAQDLSELGQCGIVQHEIHLTDPVPTHQKPYRVPYQLKSEMKRQRLAADLRKLNSKTIPDNFPLPNLNEIIDMLSGAKYFTTMDLTSGFHQMLLHPNSTHLTGITTEFGLFEYKRLPFGLSNSSSSFQRLMSIVLNGLSDLQIGCYIDDIIIASNDFDQHSARLELVFQRLLTANLKVKPSKCAFLQFEITFLGHTVKEGKVLPDSKNLKSIKDSLPPNSKKKIKHVNEPTNKQNVHINRLIKIEKREIFPTVQSENSLADEDNEVMSTNNVDNDTVSNEEEILKLYPCYTLPYKDWMDDQQNVISNTIQSNQLSIQNVQHSTNTPNNSEREEPNTPICNLTQNQPHDHTIVTNIPFIQPLTNLPISPVIDKKYYSCY
ncbi:Retrovirus-related Pol polyprotein from transposon 17.6 [Araneus ventricosus]|uniref:Retrovirus-related Pol polyprotein from transposon 17.6 n=1 Tax=Araneus ventricosus TaxID=182803 RepID=A0A4Y2WB67_ARAVE|nr:Retrovirus-related Pol polyprotein from transposon 17.6 [Araneus ventricosus]